MASESAPTAAEAVVILLMSEVEPAPLETDASTAPPVRPVTPSAIPTLDGAAPKLTLNAPPALRKRTPSAVLPALTSLKAASFFRVESLDAKMALLMVPTA